MSNMNTNNTNQQNQQSQSGAELDKQGGLQALGITPLGKAPLPNSSQSQSQDTQGINSLGNDSSQDSNMMNQQSVNPSQGNLSSASQVPGGEMPNSPIPDQSTNMSMDNATGINQGTSSSQQAGISPNQSKAGQGGEGSMLSTSASNYNGGSTNSQRGNVGSQNLSPELEKMEGLAPQVDQIQAISQNQGKDLYGYQPSINPNDTIELSDLGMTKGSKSSQYSQLSSGNFKSIGADRVEGGVPTNSLLATQRSTVSPNPDQYTIVAVRYDGSGISAVQLNTGDIISAEQAVQLTEQGMIAGVHTGGTRGSSPHKTLVSNPDGDTTNNLSNLPRF